MKQRILYLIKYYLWLILIFSMGRIAFLLYNQEGSHSLNDFLQVVIHGWRLDCSMIGYMAILPWLILLISVWFKKVPLRKILRPYLWIVAIIIGIVLVVDTALYAFWGFKLDATVFNYIVSPKEAAASVSVGYIVLRFIAILIVIGIIALPLERLTPTILTKVDRPIVGTLAFIVIGGLMFVGIRGSIDRSTANVGMSYFSDEQILNHAAINPCFNLFYSMGKQEDYKSMYHSLTEEERSKLMEGLYEQPQPQDTTQMVLNTDRPNILLIQWEGFGGIMSGLEDGRTDIAPEFNALIPEGVYFDHYYSNSYRTDRGTVTTLAGYLACPNLSIMKEPALSRNLPTIAKSLAAVGYEREFLYGGDINFTNTKGFLSGAGYQKLFSQDDFPRKERDNAWGVNDEWTFQWLIKHLKEMPKGQLWHFGYQTISSHEPWEVPYKRLSDNVENSFAYTDHCLGEFIKTVKKDKELWNNLLIIIIPDHSCHVPGKGEVNSEGFFHCPMLWLGGAVKQPARISVYTNQSDLAATLLAQMKLPTEQFTFSRNVLSSGYHHPFVFSCFNDGFMVADTTGVTIFDNASQKILSGNQEKQVQQGKAILQSLYDDMDRLSRQK